MRKTKCKSCNGLGKIPYLENSLQPCPAKCDNGVISVYTIQELREGKVVIQNDDNEASVKLLFKLDLNREWNGSSRYYLFESGCLIGSNSNRELPTQSVKIFLEEIEQDEKIDQITEKVFPNCERVEPEFKWGEEVDCEDASGWNEGFLYGCKFPSGLKMDNFHIVFDKRGNVGLTPSVRKAKPKITITLSEAQKVLAEKHGVKPEQIEIKL